MTTNIPDIFVSNIKAGSCLRLRLENKIRQLISMSENKYRLAGVVILGQREEKTRPGYIWLYNRHLHGRFIEEFNGVYFNESPLLFRFNSESSTPFAIQHNYPLMDDYAELEQKFNEVVVELDEETKSLRDARDRIRELEVEVSSSEKHMKKLQILLHFFHTNVPQPLYESIMHQHQRSLNLN